jgi:formylglycine-generating enzyme required for sulfatase activity/outer membrane protein OmpA-like peptidoglycan-associated protein
VEGAVALRSACLSVFAACGLMMMAAPSKAQDPQAGGASAAPPAATAPSSPAVAAPAAPAPVPPVLIPVQLNEAIQKAANALMSKVPEPAGDSRELVIDPLVDGYTGAQNVATIMMGNNITTLVKQTYGRFKVVPFTSATLSKQPLLLIGTFRPINTRNEPTGTKDAYHICLAMLDLKTGTVVSKGVARALPEGVDVTPTAFFQDAPVWVPDLAISGYIKTCQATKVGDQIDQTYADRIVVASLVSDAIEAYNGKRYKDAVDLYTSALRTPGGDQLRVHNGLYLANWRLKRTADATEAFGKLVDYGLKSSKIAVNFLFVPNSTIFFTPKDTVDPYQMWLKVIGERGTASNACLEIVGHTSRTGPQTLNDRLSVLRAQYVRDRLIAGAPALASRTIATGLGSKEVIVGTGTNDEGDALDRRVEFKPLPCLAEQQKQEQVKTAEATTPTRVVNSIVERPAPFQDCTDCPVLVRIPAGSFMMGQAKGDPSAAPQRAVTIPAFAIGQYPVTVGEWKACVGGGGCGFTPRMTNADDRTPVHNVSWDDAEQYIDWLSRSAGKKYRFPTEAEWEYAARANTTTRYWWGDNVGTMLANCSDCGGSQDGKTPIAVGSFKPNPFGINDVHGGVAQWVADCWFPNYQGAPANASVRDQRNCQKRVLRGGSFRNDREAITAAARGNYDASVRYIAHGFRVARDLN